MAAPRKHMLKDMTFMEFRERLPENPVILLPFGSQEEQGPHGAMGDYMLSEELASRVAAATDAIAAPTVPFGYADVFRCMPGGIQLRAETFCNLFEDVATAFLDHGLTRLVVFNGHTGNASLIDQMTRRLRQKHGLVIPAINIWKIVPPELWKKLHGSLGEKAGGHGADPITSVYLHLFPDVMRLDLIGSSQASPALGLPTSGVSAVTFEGMPIQVPLNVDEVNPLGMIGGDPKRSSAEIGAAMTDHIVSFTARFIEHFRQCDPREMSKGPMGHTKG